jgi:inositol oxygenase
MTEILVNSEHPETVKPVEVPEVMHADKTHDYRNFTNGRSQSRVERFYTGKYSNQTLEYARAAKALYGQFNHARLSIWDATALLDQVVDQSDPDIDTLTQLHHAIQTGEACRQMYPDLDWFHLVGFVHDLGKVLATPPLGALEQWAVVGDTYPVGCRLSEANVLHDLTSLCPDMSNPQYNTELGIYQRNCGFDNLNWAWGHDEYLYMVLKNHAECTLPLEAMYCIRFHSFYPWHNKGGYTYLANDTDMAMQSWVQKFQKCDLYSKIDISASSVEELSAYYQGLIQKYIPGVVAW